MTSTCLFALQTTTGHPLDVIFPDVDREICKLVCGAVWQCWRHRYRGYSSARPSSSFLSSVVDMTSMSTTIYGVQGKSWAFHWCYMCGGWVNRAHGLSFQSDRNCSFHILWLWGRLNYTFFANIKILVFELKLVVKVESLNFDLVGFQKCTVFLTNLLISVPCSGLQDLLPHIFNQCHYFRTHASHAHTS